MKTRVAVVQMTSTDDVSANLEKVRRLTEDAVSERAKLVLYPEAFAFLGADERRAGIAEVLPEGGEILQVCRDLAKKHQLHLVFGGFWETCQEGQVYNTCIHLDPEGELRAAYRKIHLFDVDLQDGTSLRESNGVTAGKETVVTDVGFGCLGLSTCYDVRFPELYRELIDKGATMLAVPSAFTTTTGKDHWHVLLRARAIENQSYVFAPAQYGRHSEDRRSYGHALICDPWGCVVAECPDGEGMAVAAVDPERVAAVRRDLPSLAKRRT